MLVGLVQVLVTNEVQTFNLEAHRSYILAGNVHVHHVP